MLKSFPLLPLYDLFMFWLTIKFIILCRNPRLGLVTKAMGCKVLGQEGDPIVTSHAPESAKSVRE